VPVNLRDQPGDSVGRRRSPWAESRSSWRSGACRTVLCDGRRSFDVANAAGVSPTTVSHALNRRGQVDPRTRARVIEAARRLGYRPNQHQCVAGRQRRIDGAVVVEPQGSNLLLTHLHDTGARNIAVAAATQRRESSLAAHGSTRCSRGGWAWRNIWCSSTSARVRRVPAGAWRSCSTGLRTWTASARWSTPSPRGWSGRFGETAAAAVTLLLQVMSGGGRACVAGRALAGVGATGLHRGHQAWTVTTAPDTRAKPRTR
jgi:Bacterial regulatory proteins, lacI family